MSFESKMRKHIQKVFERLYCEQMVDWMGDLALPRYGLQKYIDPDAAKSATAKEKQILDNLSRAGKRMMGFCRSGFYKRMDSSGVAFLMSLYRHAVRNAMYLHAIKEGLDLPVRASDTDVGNGIDEANKEFILPDFVEDPNTKNEGMEYEEIAFDPYDSANGELVDQKEVSTVDAKAIHKLLAKVGDGIL